MTSPIDYAVDGGVDRDQQWAASYTQENGGRGGVTGVPSTPHPSSHLPLPTPFIQDTLTRFPMITASQLRRLLYHGTERGTKVRASRHLLRLWELGKVRRRWGIFEGYGQKEYVYYPPGKDNPPKPDDHTLWGVELYVRIIETLGRDVIYEFEPHQRIGPVELQDDWYLELGPEHKFFIEIDLDTEKPARLREKMRNYVHAYEDYWDEQKHDGKFPLVTWIVQTPRRARTMEEAIRAVGVPHIFTVILFEAAAPKLTRGL